MGALCLLVPALAANADDVALPAATQVQLFMRILAFDRGLSMRAADGVVLAIVHQGKFRQSVNERNAIVEALSAYDSVTVGTRRVPLTVAPIDLDAEDLHAALVAHHADLLYVAPVRAVDIGSIASISKLSKVPSLTGVPAYVRAGLGVGLDLRGERPEIVINLTAAREAGADFDAQLLQLATIVR